MHLLLCHERFQARFGVDRLLLRCAEEFRAQGHTVTLAGMRFDPSASESADRIIEVPAANPYIESDLHTCAWLAERWDRLFAEAPPTVVLSAGWPFFSTLGLCADRGCRTIFIDCGITPPEGLPEGARKTLHLLDGLKRAYLPLADAITPISDFLRESQVRAIASASQLIRTIRLCGDHVLEKSGDTGGAQPNPAAPDVVLLGRFECGNYKQGELVAPLAADLAALVPGVKVGVLATAEELAGVPAINLPPNIVPLGHPDDGALRTLIKSARLTVVLSRWEGFNLPLAESAVLGTHCLVFRVGAHAEVVPDPWYLCQDAAEMTRKASLLLQGEAPAEIQGKIALAAYAGKRTWKDVATEYIALVNEVLATPQRNAVLLQAAISRQDLWLIDVTNAARDTANSGVVRVCRRLSAELGKLHPVLFVIWDAALRTFRFPYDAEFEHLGSYGGPARAPGHPASRPREPLLLNHYFSPHTPLNGWLVMPEIRHEPDFSLIRSQTRAWGLKLGAVFYDAIPLLRPDLVADPSYRDGHEAYMRGLSACDIVLPISQRSAQDLREFWCQWGMGHAFPTTCVLPGNATTGRRASAEGPKGNVILCVSTLEPRKGHGRLIEAFLAATAASGTPWELVLVGNRYAGAPEIATHVENVCKVHPHIHWKGVVTDAELSELYRTCEFTVFASEIEGFGLPIMESLWNGRPCVCHNSSVMAELARDGGCHTANLSNLDEFRDALLALMTDPGRRDALRTEAATRPIKTWQDYGREFLGRLLIVERVVAYQPPPAAVRPPKWDEFLYPKCILRNWQMNDSERIALTALLVLLRPRLAIEVGTFRGGSLSLIRQHCDMVFSIDIDPIVRTDFAWMTNVSFLTGSSRKILPPFFNALAAADMHPGLMLIDGDHSTEGIRADIECVLDFVPREPCVVVMHDTANAKCRNGQLAARWARSPYVHHVDLDFVPGRIVEHGGGSSGEIWGGLGLALLLPVPREHTLCVGGSAHRMITQLQEIAAQKRS